MAVTLSPMIYAPDITWTRFPDAPFSRRADMQTYVREMTSPLQFRLYVVGGQTGHQCGLREFGVCDNEIWWADLTRTSLTEVALTWASVAYVPPWSARCGATIFGFDLYMRGTTVTGAYSALAGITGGQLSYSDPSCHASPVSVNETWYAVLNVDNTSSWYRGPDAPFSARRSQQHDPYFAHSTSKSMFSALLVGGMRILSHRVNESTGLAVLTAVEMYADVWECVMPDRPLVGVSICNWGLRDFPADSTPLPTAGGPQLWASGGVGNALIGGQTSLAAIAAFRNTPPNLRLEPHKVNMSLIQVNLTVLVSPRMGSPAATLDELMQARQQLPLTWTVEEEEINGDSPYRLGSDWVISRYAFDVYQHWYNFPAVSAVHYQPMAMIERPEQSDLFNLQEVSSLNTTRGLFNFPLRRLGHGSSLRSIQSQWVLQTVSGGRSGESYNNDWLELCDPACMQLEESVYRYALGPVIASGTVWNKAGDTRSVICADGYHWEPPSSSLRVTLTCAPNGMWMNLDTLTVQSCQPDERDCAFPLVDLGFDECEEPRPVLHRITAYGANNLDNFTIVDVFPIGLLSLTIYGSYFSLPLKVLVGGRECEQPELWTSANGTSAQVCQDDGIGRVCELYADEVHCLMPVIYGLNLPVTMQSGFSGFLVEVLGGRGVATISPIAPIIYNISSPECTYSSQVQLTNCSIANPFTVTIKVEYPTVAPGFPLSAYLASSDRLNCTAFLEYQGDTLYASDYRADCVVRPRLGQLLPLVVLQNGLPLQSLGTASMSFRSCGAGTTTNVASLTNSSAPVCLPCPPGYFSASGESACEPCRPGTFANESGLAVCSLCEPGYHMPYSNATTCATCPLNSVAAADGSVSCSQCSLNTYIVYDTEQDGSRTRARGNCTQCPDGADCLQEGRILSQGGTFLLVDQGSGTVSSVPCASSACLPAESCGDSSVGPPELIERSSLEVWNCCGEGRFPASSTSTSSAPQLNLLCADCLPGYSVVSGRCIPCAEVQWGPLIGKLLLAFILTYAVHRLPHDWSGSAAFTSGSYFIQLTLLFLASGALPPALTVFNLSLIGDHRTRGFAPVSGDGGGSYMGGCTLPAGDYGRIGEALLSPLIAYLLLGVLLLVQLLCRAALNALPTSSTQPLQAQLERTLLDSPDQQLHVEHRKRGDAWAHLVYHSLFSPSRVRVLPVDAASSSADIGRAPAYTTDPSVGVHLLDPICQPNVGADSLPHILRCYQRTAVRLVGLSYTPVSAVALSYFSTVAVGQYGHRLVDYPTIDTASSAYRSMVGLMAVLIALAVVGLPLALLVWLYRRHREGTILEVRERLQATVGSPQSEAVTELSPAGAALLLQVTAQYRAALWWYPPFNLVRRLLLVALLTFILDVSLWIWLTLANSLLLMVHLYVRPYSRPMDNTVEMLNLLSLTLQTTILNRWPPPYMDATLMAVMMSVVAGPLLYMVGVAVMERWQRLQYRRRLRAAASAVNSGENGQVDSGGGDCGL